MTSPIQLVEKIDDFAVNDSISEIAFLATGLLQLQHARYPHLVPMYRTVHRKIPRPMVFRAIRWVNPKRMFPGAGLTEEEMKNMSSDELEKLIVKLNDYRGEAHVIHNRYNEMLDMIEMGELPYYIPYAGFTQDKWTMLQEYKDRALRLKEGTEDWEDVLDNQAAAIKKILLNRDGDDKRKFDDIDGLWQDAKGNPAAPNFYNPKKGKGKKQFLRVMRNGQLINPPKVYARRYIAVPKGEIRRGEEVRMPAGGQVRRPRNRRERRIFDEFGGAAEHLLRMPRGPFLGSDRRLRERGNLISMPAGRENPLIVTYSEISADDVANRRVGRWTHTDPLGKRGQAPHRGAASRGAAGSIAQEGPEPHGPQASEALRGREQRIRERSGPGTEVGDSPQAKAVQLNTDFANNAAALYQKYGIDDQFHQNIVNMSENDIAELLNASDGDLEGGLSEIGTMLLKTNDGTRYVYKIAIQEQKSEQLATILNNVLDLDVSVNAGIKQFDNPGLYDKHGHKMNAMVAVHRNETLSQALQMGAGHLQEFCAPNCLKFTDAAYDDPQRMVDLVNTDEFRADAHKMALLDFIGGNWDRHGANFMITEDGKLQGIDNGYFGGYTQGGMDSSGPGRLFDTSGGSATKMRWMWMGDLGGSVNSTMNDIVEEASGVFDRYFDETKIKDIQDTLGLENAMSKRSTADIKEAYLKNIKTIWQNGIA